MLPPVQRENAGDWRTDALYRFRYCFYKIMFPFAANKLRLPKKFSQRYGGNLSPVVRVIAPTERVWPVTLKNPGNNVWFREGWPEFVRHHAIKVWSFLVFTYEGDSSFRVHIYDPSTVVRRKYMSDVPSILEDEDQGNDYLVVDEKHDEADDSSVQIIGSSPHPCPGLASRSEMQEDEDQGNEYYLVVDEEHDEADSEVEIIGSSPHPCPGLASRSEMQKPLPPPRQVTRSKRESYPTRSPPTRNKTPKQHPTPGTGALIEVCQPQPIPRPTTRNQVHKRQPTPRPTTRNQVHKIQPTPRPTTRNQVHKRQPTPRPTTSNQVHKRQPPPWPTTRNQVHKRQPTPRLATRSEVHKRQPTTRLATRLEVCGTQPTRLVTRSEARKTLPTPRLATRSELRRPHPTSRPATTNVNHTPRLTPMPAVQSETRELCPTLEPATNSTMLELYPTRRLSKRIETLKRGRPEESRQSKRAKNVEEDNNSPTGGVHSLPVDEDVELCYVGGNAETPASAVPICAAGLFSSQNPFFMVTLRPNRCGSFTVNFPHSFAKKYLSKGLEHIKLQVANGRQHLIHCTRRKEVPKCLGEGWPAFVLDHGLVEDDVCIFELIENHGDDVLFQVHTIVVCG